MDNQIIIPMETAHPITVAETEEQFKARMERIRKSINKLNELMKGGLDESK